MEGPGANEHAEVRLPVLASERDIAFAQEFESAPEARAELEKVLGEVLEAHPEISDYEVILTALRGEGGFIIAALPPELADIVPQIGRIQALRNREWELTLDEELEG